MYATADELIGLGISRKLLTRCVSNGKWVARERRVEGSNETVVDVLISSLPKKVQLQWAQQKREADYPERMAVLLSEIVKFGIKDRDNEIKKLLAPLNESERIAWMAESLRLARIVAQYDRIQPKRQRDEQTGSWMFVTGVLELCHEAVCKDELIIIKHPHRKNEVSPYTLDGWSRAFHKMGLTVFLPKIKKSDARKKDKRRAVISGQAIDWINNNWHHFSGPYHLYNALEKEASERGWRIPSKSWIYRQWRNIPKIVKEYRLEGRQAYESKSAPYVPRDFSDLAMLQVLCGDHSERDVTFMLPDNTLARPWLTLWYELRAGLIWGWYLSLVPSSFTAGLAYADGVRNFGAQPLSRPEEGFFSYVYTDRGRDYLSHNWDGKVIAVHKEAMRLDGGIEFMLFQRRVGLLDELQLKHLIARGRNPKEKPVERVHKDISAWERNTFTEYCGRDAKSRPELWKEMYVKHLRFVNGKIPESPFRPLEVYREELAKFITRYNETAHERPTLASGKVVPLEEYRRLYTTRYDISPDTLSLLLMKAEKRIIRKNGVQCFQKHWFYLHEAMSQYKGKSVEVRYSDDNYNSVMVVLPNMQLCEASLVTPSLLLNPNRETLKTVKKVRAHERRLMSEYEFISQSQFRGETTEDRVARTLVMEEDAEVENDAHLGAPQAAVGQVHQLTHLDHVRRASVTKPLRVTSREVMETESDESIFGTPSYANIREFDYDE